MITLFHQVIGSIKICKKSTLINTTQQQKEKEKEEEEKQELRLMFGYQPSLSDELYFFKNLSPRRAIDCSKGLFRNDC